MGIVCVPGIEVYVSRVCVCVFLDACTNSRPTGEVNVKSAEFQSFPSHFETLPFWVKRICRNPSAPLSSWWRRNKNLNKSFVRQESLVVQIHYRDVWRCWWVETTGSHTFPSRTIIKSISVFEHLQTGYFGTRKYVMWSCTTSESWTTVWEPLPLSQLSSHLFPFFHCFPLSSLSSLDFMSLVKCRHVQS